MPHILSEDSVWWTFLCDGDNDSGEVVSWQRGPIFTKDASIPCLVVEGEDTSLVKMSLLKIFEHCLGFDTLNFGLDLLFFIIILFNSKRVIIMISAKFLFIVGCKLWLSLKSLSFSWVCGVFLVLLSMISSDNPFLLCCDWS